VQRKRKMAATTGEDVDAFILGDFGLFLFLLLMLVLELVLVSLVLVFLLAAGPQQLLASRLAASATVAL
jgi:hypothetical protein